MVAHQFDTLCFENMKRRHGKNLYGYAWLYKASCRYLRLQGTYRGVMTEPPEIDSTGPKLVYVQVADWITGRIERGELRPGHKLPAERDIAADIGVGYMTVRRAMRLLRERGLIVTVVGRGTFVTEDRDRQA